MIERLEHLGKLVEDSAIPGERRADNVRPAHPNGIQLSRDRFLILKSTLGFRGIARERSGLWPPRDDARGHRFDRHLLRPYSLR